MRCPSCKGTVVSPDGQNGEKVCSACGLVLRRVPYARERSYAQWNPQWHSNWHESDSETLKEWLTTLRTVSCQLNLPNFPYREEAARKIRKEAKTLFKSQKLGKNKRATIAAILHNILKQYAKNRSLKEICTQLSLDSKQVLNQSWTLNKTTINKHSQFVTTPRKTPTDYLFERGGKITSNTKLLIEANETLAKTKGTGGNPIALAAGALYHTLKNKKLKVTKEQIGEAFGISHRTVYTNEARIRTILQRIKPKDKQTMQNAPLILVSRKTRHP